jgi:hypothetical protein
MAHFCKLPSVQAVQVFSIPLGDTWELGLWGIDNNTGDLKPLIENSKVAVVYPPLFPNKNGLATFAVKAQGLGGSDLNGVNGSGRSWALAKILVVPPVLPPKSGPEEELLDADTDYRVHTLYIDRVVSGHYEIGSNVFNVEHEDGSKIDLDYNFVLSSVRSAKGGSSGPRVISRLTGFMMNRKIQKIVPLQYTEETTPNIAAMVLETDEVVQNNEALTKIATSFLDIIKTYAAANTAMKGAKPMWKAVPRGGGGGAASGGGFNPIPYGQSAQSLGKVIGLRAAEGAKTAGEVAKRAEAAGQIGEKGFSWINRIISAVRPLKLSPKDSAEVIESATKAAGYDYGPRGAIQGYATVVTSARTGANQFIVAIRPDGTIQRGLATIEILTDQFPPVAKLSAVVLASP